MAEYINEQAEKAKTDYLAGMKYKDIAEKYGVSINTVNSWKKRHKWCRDGAPKNSAPKENGAPKKRGGQPNNKNATGSHGEGNQNAVGNNGGAPPRNGNAVKHGLYARYLPEEIFEITKQLEGMSQLDMLWGNIEILSARILFAQPIMHVEGKNDLTKELKSDGEKSTTYELQFAWDKQAKSLAVQSKAMKDLTGMIKQYDELCKSDLATEEQRLRIEKLKIEVAGQSGGNTKEDPFDELSVDELRALINEDD